ncbi:hypothetical protein IAD21_05536 [Abditibacteriota bacterium]|nr:hypothetical protein IAD21_05536 [Abditibacteriota bacterium]
MNNTTPMKPAPRPLKKWGSPLLTCHGTVAQLTQQACPPEYPEARSSVPSGACGLS